MFPKSKAPRTSLITATVLAALAFPLVFSTPASAATEPDGSSSSGTTVDELAQISQQQITVANSSGGKFSQSDVFSEVQRQFQDEWTAREEARAAEAARLKAEEEARIAAEAEAQRKAAEEAAAAEAAAKAKRSNPSSSAAPGYTGGGSKDEWLLASGIDESDWALVDYIVSKESSWNPNAVNSSSGASGLVQALPCGKVPGSCFDPVDNLRWADGYAKNRYGSWEAAYNFWTSNHWW